MRRDAIYISIALWSLIIAVVAILILPPEKAHADSRLYPYLGAVWHAESGLTGRTWAEIGTSYSLGRLAPSVTGQFALSGQPAVGLDVRLRIKLGH